MSQDAEEVGLRIQSLRKSRTPFRTQGELASAVKITRSALAQYESGRVLAPLAVLEPISQLYGVELSYFFGEGQKIALGGSGNELALFEYNAMVPMPYFGVIGETVDRTRISIPSKETTSAPTIFSGPTNGIAALGLTFKFGLEPRTFLALNRSLVPRDNHLVLIRRKELYHLAVMMYRPAPHFRVEALPRIYFFAIEMEDLEVQGTVIGTWNGKAWNEIELSVNLDGLSPRHVYEIDTPDYLQAMSGLSKNRKDGPMVYDAESDVHNEEWSDFGPDEEPNEFFASPALEELNP